MKLNIFNSIEYSSESSIAKQHQSFDDALPAHSPNEVTIKTHDGVLSHIHFDPLTFQAAALFALLVLGFPGLLPLPFEFPFLPDSFNPLGF